MATKTRICASCKNGLSFFPSEEDSPSKGLYECTLENCDLLGMSQPEQDGQSIAAFGKDGSVTVIRKGRVSQNELNLPIVIARIKGKIPNYLTVHCVDGPERGADLIVKCSKCSSQKDIQVVRAVDHIFAKGCSKNEIFWKKYEAKEVIQRLQNELVKKTSRHIDRADQILVIDTPVEAFWTPILGGLSATRNMLGHSGWWSMVILSPSAVVTIDGNEPMCWCNCCNSV